MGIRHGAAKAVGAVNFGVAFRWLFDALLG